MPVVVLTFPAVLNDVHQIVANMRLLLTTVFSVIIVNAFACREDFERFVGYALSDRLSDFVIESKNPKQSDHLMFDCHKSCKENPSCFAFVLRLQRLECIQYSYLSGNDASLFRTHLTVDHDSITFRKICLLNIPGCANYMWRYDVEPRRALRLDRIESVHKVDSLAMCELLCSREKQFPCQSAVYNYVTKNCQLSRYNKRTVPFDFFETRPDQVYIENQCVANMKFKRCDFFDQNGVAIVFALSEVHATSADACRQLCLNSTRFPCRSYVFSPATKRCRFGPDDSFVTAPLHHSSARPMAFKQLGECMDVNVSCGEKRMEAYFRGNQIFDGKVVLINSSSTSCSFDVVNRNQFSVLIPIGQGKRCGLPPRTGSSVAALVKLQYHDLVWTTKDRLYRLICKYSGGQNGIENFVDVSVPTKRKPPIKMNNLSRTVPKLPSVFMRITDEYGKLVHEAEVDDTLFVEVGLKGDIPKPFFVTNCVAHGKQTDIPLTDDRGCPLDGAIMGKFVPAFDRRGVKILKAKFQGLPLKSRKTINIHCNVNFCEYVCPEFRCNEVTTDEKGTKRRRKEVQYVGTSANVQTAIVSQAYTELMYTVRNEETATNASTRLVYTAVPVAMLIFISLAFCYFSSKNVRKQNCDQSNLKGNH